MPRKKPPTHGGRRKGAGRPVSPDSMGGMLRIRMPQGEIDALRHHVGKGSVSMYVRELIAEAVKP